MARTKLTEQERKARATARVRKWQQNNPERYQELILKSLQKKGFNTLSEYVKQSPSYKSYLKHNQPEKFKTLHESKPDNTKQHPEFLDYHVDTEGNVWKFSTKRKSWLKITTQLNKSGYYTIQLYIGKKRYLKYHHKIVAEAWIGECPVGMECDHINRDKSDNKPSNLQYLTKIDNLARRRKKGKKLLQ